MTDISNQRQEVSWLYHNAEFTNAKSDNRVNFFSKAPSGPPLSVAFISCTKESLSVSWRAPDEDVRNGKLTGYQVCYSNKTKPTCIERNTTLTYTIHNLKPATKYFVTVSAGTSAGFGTKSPEINKTTNGGEYRTIG